MRIIEWSNSVGRGWNNATLKRIFGIGQACILKEIPAEILARGESVAEILRRKIDAKLGKPHEDPKRKALRSAGNRRGNEIRYKIGYSEYWDSAMFEFEAMVASPYLSAKDRASLKLHTLEAIDQTIQTTRYILIIMFPNKAWH